MSSSEGFHRSRRGADYNFYGFSNYEFLRFQSMKRKYLAECSFTAVFRDVESCEFISIKANNVPQFRISTFIFKITFDFEASNVYHFVS